MYVSRRTLHRSLSMSQRLFGMFVSQSWKLLIDTREAQQKSQKLWCFSFRRMEFVPPERALRSSRLCDVSELRSPK